LVSGAAYHAEADSQARFISHNELRYSLRSLHMFAPWVRRVFIVTDDQAPSWLQPNHQKIKIVSHREIFRDPSVLPTYNSHAIESQLHHIPNLAEHFLYFNDDMFLGRAVPPHLFFTPAGISKFFLSQSRVPIGPVETSDTPVDAAHKNNRRLLFEKYGRTITQTLQHVPYALRCDVLSSLEQEFAEEHVATAATRFRSTTDLSVTSSLAHFYAYFQGRALPASLKYSYIQLAVPDLALRLDRLLYQRDRDAFCLNDAYSTTADIEVQETILEPFLQSYFPVAAPWEKDDRGRRSSQAAWSWGA